ncbi:MAG: hypothetical protein KF809_09670 [Chloroflexi bacterium]|nr:hypothetical protein [Chloroflexota bacterium]
MGLSLVWVLSGLPLAASLATGEGWLAALAGLPLLIGTTGMFGSFARVADGEPVRMPGRDGFDVSLAGIAWLWVLAIIWIVGAGATGVVAASILGALGVLVLPLAFGYSAIRRRRGSAAVRAAVVLGILKPGLAVTLAGASCLAAFACIASAGTLLVVGPPLAMLMACRAIWLLVEPADGQTGVRTPRPAD